MWVRARRGCSNVPQGESAECAESFLRRVVWDGSVILDEVQVPGDSAQPPALSPRTPKFREGQKSAYPPDSLHRLPAPHSSGNTLAYAGALSVPNRSTATTLTRSGGGISPLPVSA